MVESPRKKVLTADVADSHQRFGNDKDERKTGANQGETTEMFLPPAGGDSRCESVTRACLQGDSAFLGVYRSVYKGAHRSVYKDG
jgi:hypothetical protein